MSHPHPFLSPVGLLGAFAMIVGLGLSIWLAGGAAFSHGPLTAFAAGSTGLGGFHAHAEFENDCHQCHAPWRGLDTARCENCHDDVTAQRTSGVGLHRAIPPDQGCAGCHPDHRGRQFTSSAIARAQLDHEPFGFSLARHTVDYAEQPMPCEGCHTGREFALNQNLCTDCHAEHDPLYMADHTAAFSADCLACHDGSEITAEFDHAATGFPLDGGHADLFCSDCHSSTRSAADTSTRCADCHAEPAMHLGLFGPNCAKCHTAQAWRPAELDGQAFDHATTRFGLVTHRQNFDGTPFTCQTCHANNTDEAAVNSYEFSTTVCADCHGGHDLSFMTTHILEEGGDCLKCHDGVNPPEREESDG